jgi:hypothetical protein
MNSLKSYDTAPFAATASLTLSAFAAAPAQAHILNGDLVIPGAVKTVLQHGNASREHAPKKR